MNCLVLIANSSKVKKPWYGDRIQKMRLETGSQQTERAENGVKIWIQGFQNESLQDGPQWYAGYFKLKAMEALWAQEKLLCLLPFNDLEEFEVMALAIIRNNQR